MQLEPWQALLAFLGTAGGSSVVTAFFNWLSQRGRDRGLARDAVQEAAREVIKTAMASAEGQIKRLEGEVESLRGEIASMREQHAEEMATLREQHAECEDRQRELKEEIDRLMAGRPAAYEPTDLRRVGKRRA